MRQVRADQLVCAYSRAGLLARGLFQKRVGVSSGVDRGFPPAGVEPALKLGGVELWVELDTRTPDMVTKFMRCQGRPSLSTEG